MKAISIKQPSASLIVNGIKDIENRSWRMPEKYKGQRVLIHASREVKNGENGHITYLGNQRAKGKDYRLIDALNQGQNWYVMENNPALWCDINERKLPLGAIIGSVELVDCVINHSSIWAEKTPMVYLGKLTIECQPPIYNWVLANPILFPEPIPAKGKLSFWNFPNIIYQLKHNETMTTEEAMKTLKRHNRWRRGANIEMDDPKKLGEALDEAIRVMKKSIKTKTK